MPARYWRKRFCNWQRSGNEKLEYCQSMVGLRGTIAFAVEYAIAIRADQHRKTLNTTFRLSLSPLLQLQ
jgi:hypothetical protein